MSNKSKSYQPSPTGMRLHSDTTNRVKAVMGPVGSGKSVISIMELVRLAEQQHPNALGVRPSRWAIIRNTYPQLRTTVIKTFQMWIPNTHCPIVYDAPIRGNLKYKMADGTSVDAEFIFMAADNVEKIESDLLSLELTGGWMNEAGEMDERVFSALMSRIPRYPAAVDVKVAWHGVLLDYNPPAIGSWLYNMFERDNKPGYVLYKQPPALIASFDEDDPDDMSLARFIPNPDAENVGFIQNGYEYWTNLVSDNLHNPNFIRRFVLAEYTLGDTGRPIFPAFRPTRHTTKETPKSRKSKLIIGIDFGLTPAACFGQLLDGRLVIQKELTSEDMSLMEFMEDLLIPTIRAEYAGYEILVVGDPSGVGRSDIDKRSPIGVLAAHGIPVVPALSNSPPIRFDAVNWFLRRLDAFLVNAECETIIGGFGGGYKWKESRGTVVKKADKNFYSHVMDSVQYMCLHFKQGTSDSLFATSGLTPTLASSKSSKQKKSFLYV